MKSAKMRVFTVLGVVSITASLFTVAGCGGDEDAEDLGECPPSSEAQQSAGRLVLNNNCLSCHSSQLTGVARQGAPEEYNFDKLDVVRSEVGEIYGEVEEGEMPPAPATKITGQDLENLRIWLACGAPDVK